MDIKRLCERRDDAEFSRLLYTGRAFSRDITIGFVQLAAPSHPLTSESICRWSNVLWTILVSAVMLTRDDSPAYNKIWSHAILRPRSTRRRIYQRALSLVLAYINAPTNTVLTRVFIHWTSAYLWLFTEGLGNELNS